MKNVAIIISTLSGGGAERSAGALSKALCKRYNVYLFLLNTSNIDFDYGGTVVDLSQGAGMGLHDYLKKCKEKYQIDCAISFKTSSNVANIITRGRECVIVSERGAASPSASFMQRESIQRFYNCADRVISVAYGTEYDLTHNFGIDERISTTIYNFIGRQAICEGVKEEVNEEILKFVGDSKLILNIGRLYLEKNHVKLLMQFAKLINEGEDVKLLIIGDGVLKDKLDSIIKELRLDDCVRIIPYTKNPFPYFKLASMFALTSDFEGLPNVVLEAMLLGTPVVAVDCLSGPRELLKGTPDYENRLITGIEVCPNGILVGQATTDETGETCFFKDAMKLLLHNDSLREKIAGNACRYMEQYQNEDILNRWIDVIEHTERKTDCLPEAKIPEIETAKKLIVYGAGKIGQGVMREYISRKDELALLCFAVTDKSSVATSVMDIPVYSIRELLPHREDALVVVGVGFEYEQEVIAVLEQYGFQYVFPNYPFVV